jgi:pimeloyl-ACP methyl ester carboxylesterase
MFIRSGGARLAAAACGGGDLVVLLHAGVADKRMWTRQLQALSASHRAVAYDRRGFGATESADEDYSHGRDLLAVLDANRAEAAILIGCSQGGRIAIDTALEHPHRVRALVLVAPAISGEAESDSYPPPVQALIEALGHAEEAGDIDRINALEAHAWLDGPLAPEGRVSGGVRELFLAMNGAALRSEPLGTQIEPASAIDRLGRIAQPTLVIWGDLDFPEVQQRCRDLVAVLPDARACEIPGTAHLPNLERPLEFNHALLEFLAGLES